MFILPIQTTKTMNKQLYTNENRSSKALEYNRGAADPYGTQKLRTLHKKA